MRYLPGRRQGLALLAGAAVWAAIFAGMFICAVYFAQSEAAAYLGLLFLPQVVSSVAGAAAYIFALRKGTSLARGGQRFALVTSVIAAFAGVLTTLLLDHEMPGGLEFAGFFALVFFIAATVDSLVALLGGALVDRIAASARSASGDTGDDSSDGR